MQVDMNIALPAGFYRMLAKYWLTSTKLNHHLRYAFSLWLHSLALSNCSFSIVTSQRLHLGQAKGITLLTVLENDRFDRCDKTPGVNMATQTMHHTQTH